MHAPTVNPVPRIVGFFPIFNTGGAVSYIAGSMYGAFSRRGVDARLWVPSSDPSARRPYIREGVPASLRGLAYRVAGDVRVRRLAEDRFLADLRPGDVAHVWPGFSEDNFRRVKERGAVLAYECINCALPTAKEILDREAATIGVPGSGITPEGIAAERRQHQAADFLFAPSPLVRESLLNSGVPDEKIIPCSFGWEPGRIRPGDNGPARGPDDGLRVLFVGSGRVRKGIHRLVEAWRRSGVKGKLIIAGQVDPVVRELLGDDLTRPDVELLGYVRDIGPVFHSADVFAFPSFEEGSPMVAYEAMGAGLPMLVSPMGGGGIVRDGAEAMVLPPDDVDAWAAALRRLAADEELRARMSRHAVERSAEYTFDQTVVVRLDRLAEAMDRAREREWARTCVACPA
jgi:glycosyltransferase involved in cell wall biosynthesis